MSTSSTKVSGNIAMDLLIHLTLFAYVGCCNTTKNVKSWKGRYHTPPHPHRNPNPPQPTCRRTDQPRDMKHFQRCAHVGRNVGHRSQPLQRSNHDMERDTYTARTTASIWDKTRPTCNDQPQCDAVVCSGNFRAGGYKYMWEYIHVYVSL